MKEEDKSKLVEVFNGSLWEAELVKSLLGINLERRDDSKHCPARDSSRCSSTRQ